MRCIKMRKALVVGKKIFYQYAMLSSIVQKNRENYSSYLDLQSIYSRAPEPWLVWLSGLSASLRTKRLPVQFPVRAHAWVAGQVPGRGCGRGNHTLMFLSISPSLPSL